jgi:hypothetical protein
MTPKQRAAAILLLPGFAIAVAALIVNLRANAPVWLLGLNMSLFLIGIWILVLLLRVGSQAQERGVTGREARIGDHARWLGLLTVSLPVLLLITMPFVLNKVFAVTGNTATVLTGAISTSVLVLFLVLVAFRSRQD